MIRVGIKGKLVLRRGKLVKVLMRPAMGSQVVIVRNWYHIIPQIMELRVVHLLDFIRMQMAEAMENKMKKECLVIAFMICILSYLCQLLLQILCHGFAVLVL